MSRSAFGIEHGSTISKGGIKNAYRAGKRSKESFDYATSMRAHRMKLNNYDSDEWARAAESSSRYSDAKKIKPVSQRIAYWAGRNPGEFKAAGIGAGVGAGTVGAAGAGTYAVSRKRKK